MSIEKSVHVSVDRIGIRRRPRARIAVIGNPNSGKSTLFNRLTGLRQSTGNFPGVTVEKHVGTVQLDGTAVELIDLPGIYCLGGTSADERIAVDVLLGRMPGGERPDALMVVIDATHLYQGLYLLEQLLEMQLPTLVAMTMTDVATADGLQIDLQALSRRLGGVPVFPVTATSGQGMAALRTSLAGVDALPVPEIPASWPELSRTAQQLAGEAFDAPPLARMDVLQALLHPHLAGSQAVLARLPAGAVQAARERLFGKAPPQAEEAQ